jgi:hypothetical protein
MIPKILHQIWLGDEPPHHLMLSWRRRWRELHPDWEHCYWTEVPLPGGGWELSGTTSMGRILGLPPSGVLEDLLRRACHLAQRANIWRYLVLLNYGGLYVDADVEPLRSVDPLVDGRSLVVVRRRYRGPEVWENGFLGSEPGHPAVVELVLQLPTRSPSVSLSMGCEYLTEVLRPLSHLVSFVPEDEVVFVPPSDWEAAKRESRVPVPGEAANRYPGARAVHHWGSLWHKRGFVVRERPSPAAPPPDGAYLEELRGHASRAGTPDRLRVLEWGSGRSTGVLADEVARRGSGVVVTVDHHPEYQAGVMAGLEHPEVVHPVVADLDGTLIHDRHPDASRLAYSTVPLGLEGPWDLVVVDGRRRVECCATAASVAGTETVILLHDWRRARYEVLRSYLPFGAREDDEYAVLRTIR